MDKKYYFISGLPRSGSTLLCNILNQNPDFYATSTSGVPVLIDTIKDNWNSITEFVASPNDEARKNIINNIIPNFYSSVDKRVIFDKSRAWPAQIEYLEQALNNDIKIIAMVRPVVEVLASFEKLWREHSHHWIFPQQKTNYVEWQTIEGRADLLMQPNQPVGIAYNRLQDAVDRGHSDKILFVDFNQLTAKPEETLKGIYNFLGEDYYEHDFKNVEQTTSEYDEIHGIPKLHTIRNEVKPVKKYARELLGERVFNKYNKRAFWEV